MEIASNTNMLLFRFSNYKKTNFIKEHLEVLNEEGCVWMLKAGKRSSLDKLKKIKKYGGWMVLRAPKADGSKSYLARFIDVIEEDPDDLIYPTYYNQILESDENTDLRFDFGSVSHQWFKLDILTELSEESAHNLVVTNSGKNVEEVIGTTRTAVMFIHNSRPIIID